MSQVKKTLSTVSWQSHKKKLTKPAPVLPAIVDISPELSGRTLVLNGEDLNPFYQQKLGVLVDKFFYFQISHSTRPNTHLLAARWQVIEKELHDSIVKEPASSWSSSIWVVPDGNLMVCNNFQRPNQGSEIDSYHLLQVDDLVEHLRRVWFILTLDV